MTRRDWLTGSLFAGVSLGLGGCSSKSEPLLRFARHPWPGYAFLSDRLGDLPAEQIRLVDTPSATTSMSLLSDGEVDGAGLTLDECLLARESGTPLTIIAICDVSDGADVLLVPERITSLSGLKGARIGVEQSAVGAVMLDAALKAAGLEPRDVQMVYAPFDEHERGIVDGRFDAVVTYEPVRSRLMASGMRELFSSAAIPGAIIDVLAVRPEVIASSPVALRRLVGSYFDVQQRWFDRPEEVRAALAEKLGLAENQVEGAFDGLKLPSLSENREWLIGPDRRIDQVAADLGSVLLKSRLLTRAPDLAGLADGRFLDD